MRITIDLTARHLALAAGFGLALAVGFVVGARAAGIPTTSPLFFAGTVEENGALAEGPVPIGVALFDDAIAGAPDNRVCDVPSANVDVAAGRFRIDLSTCLSAVRANPEVFAEVTVRGSPLPRVKVGAVPFAVEAERATTANTALLVAANGVDGAAIVDGDVEEADLANGAVTAAKIATGAVNGTHLADNSVDTNAIVAGAVTQAEAPFAPLMSSNIGGGAVQPRNNLRFAHLKTVVSMVGGQPNEAFDFDFAGAGFTDDNSVECMGFANDGLSAAFQPSRVAFVGGTQTVNVRITRQDDSGSPTVAGALRLQIFCMGL